MPTIEQLDSMAGMLRLGKFMDINELGVRTHVMELTIAAMQAKALSDISYNYGFSCTKGS